MSKRYTILKDDYIKWIWDSKNEQMFKESWGESDYVEGNLYTLEKFNPFISIIELTDVTPKSVIELFNEKQIEDKKFGIEEEPSK